MTVDTASTLALRVLAWLVASEKVDGLLRWSGLTRAELRSRANEQAFLAGVLMYVLSNDADASQFCTEETVPPVDLHIASRVLGGPE